MPRHLPPLNALRAFEAAGRHESFSRAADELGVSHSAISKHVRGLEDRLGAQLFQDASRGVALTQVGRSYLSALVPAFDAIAEATDLVAEVPSGTVTVNAETVFAIKWLVSRMKAFQALHPDITIELDASEVLVDIDRYEADIAIRFFLNGRPEDQSALVSNAPIYPYAAPSVAAEVDGEPERLFNYALMRDRGGSPWRDWLDSFGRPDLAMKVEQGRRMRALLAIETAISGMGVLLCSSDNVADDVAAGRLVRLFDHGIVDGEYHMLFGEGVLRRRPVRAFRDWLLHETAEFRTQ